MSTTSEQIISAPTDATNHHGLGWYQTGQDRLMTGPAHFKSERRKYKNSGYTLFTILNEYIDNVAKIAKHIDVRVSVSPSGMIECITISDDYEHGFANINEHGDKNPFNFGHMRPGQDDDEELSEFGIGMKAAAVAAGNLFTVYTKVSGDICHRVLCNFDEMEREPGVMESYNPKHKLITMEEYRAKHPFPCGSTIVLSELHPRFHEITSQAQIQREFSETISDSYSNYIHNGLIVRVNGVAVEEERDWFLDPTCHVFNINTKILILEKANSPRSPRVLVAIRTDKNTTYKKYDAPAMPPQPAKPKSKSQPRLKQFSKKELDQLLAQGYRPSHLLKSTDMHAIEINSTITLYSEDFHGKNHDEVEKPLNHVCGYKDLRKYGSFQFEPRTDGNCNYNCHKIELKSKSLGKELGLTFRKQFTLEMQNDLTRMIREIIRDNNLNLNSNADKNSKLCQRYLDEMKVDLLTCNVKKLSSHHLGIRAALLAAPAPAPILQEEAPAAPAPILQEEEEAPIDQAEAEAPILQEEAEAPIVQAEAEAPIVQAEAEAPIVQAEAPAPAPAPILRAAQDPESDSDSQQDDEPSDDDQSEQALPNLVPDSVREVGPSVHQRITCVTGKKIIEYWRNSGEHQATLDKTLDDIIISYQDRCAQDQLQDTLKFTLKFVPVEEKCKHLLHLIQKWYPLSDKDMFKGIELFRAFHGKFGDAAVAGL
jgi:hypothetical protein